MKNVDHRVIGKFMEIYKKIMNSKANHQKKVLLSDNLTGGVIISKRLDLSVLSNNYGMKYEGTHGSSPVIEVITGELMRLYMLEMSNQPTYRLLSDHKERQYLVGVDYLPRARQLKLTDFECYHQGLASILVLSMFMEEWDLKLDNIMFLSGIDCFSRIDTEWSAFSLRQPSEKASLWQFTLSEADLVGLPNIPISYKPFKFLDSELGDDSDFEIPKNDLFALSKNSQFINEKWATVLKLLITPADTISEFIDKIIPKILFQSLDERQTNTTIRSESEYVKEAIKTRDAVRRIISTRRIALLEIMKDCDVFKRFVEENGVRICKEFIGSIKKFKTVNGVNLNNMGNIIAKEFVTLQKLVSESKGTTLRMRR